MGNSLSINLKGRDYEWTLKAERQPDDYGCVDLIVCSNRAGQAEDVLNRFHLGDSDTLLGQTNFLLRSLDICVRQKRIAVAAEPDRFVTGSLSCTLDYGQILLRPGPLHVVVECIWPHEEPNLRHYFWGKCDRLQMRTLRNFIASSLSSSLQWDPDSPVYSHL